MSFLCSFHKIILVLRRSIWWRRHHDAVYGAGRIICLIVLDSFYHIISFFFHVGHLLSSQFGGSDQLWKLHLLFSDLLRNASFSCCFLVDSTIDGEFSDDESKFLIFQHLDGEFLLLDQFKSWHFWKIFTIFAWLSQHLAKKQWNS